MKIFDNIAFAFVKTITTKMNKLTTKLAFCFMLIAALSNQLKAQLSFQNGNVINLHTTEEYLYIETRMIFNTGNFKASDYSWEKKSDSLDTRWLVTACFNGDCRDDLLQSGTFLTDYGLNDTTCFIAFHVETRLLTGASNIVYHVYNKNNSADSATMFFNISYINATGIGERFTKKSIIYPNPVSSKIYIQSDINIAESTIKILNILGQEVFIQRANNNTELDVSALKNGMYFLSIFSNNQLYAETFIKQ